MEVEHEGRTWRRNRAVAHRSQVGDEEALAAQHPVGVPLGQVVEVGVGVQGGVAAGEGGGGGQQEGVEGDQLPDVQLALPGDDHAIRTRDRGIHP